MYKARALDQWTKKPQAGFSPLRIFYKRRRVSETKYLKYFVSEPRSLYKTKCFYFKFKNREIYTGNKTTYDASLRY